MVVVGAWALVVSGCGGGGDSGYDPDAASCTSGAECPSGICLEGRCVPPGGDGGGDAEPEVGEGGGDGDADVEPEVGEGGGDGDADAEPEVGEGGGDADGGADGDAGAEDGGSLADGDGDTIPDDVEGWTDADGDTVPNAEDDDSDGDDIPDGVEAADSDLRTPPPDSDRDGTADFLDTDTDGDTILDADEWLIDVDGDALPAYRDYDSDGDGIFDLQESGDRDPSTPPVDTDADGTPDYLDVDSDGDWISDAQESIVDTDLDGVQDYLDTDSDGDGVPDIDEAGDTDLTTAPASCDADSLPNFRDTDSDNDGVRDQDEILVHGTNPCLADSDGDGVTDLIEISYGSPPLDPGDSPRTRGDFVFIEPYLDDPDPWQDTLVFSTSLQKADVYFLVDCTGSMGGEITNLRSSIRATVIPGIIGAIPDSWTGVGQFDDYPYSPYGSSGDNSYSNLQSLTSDAAAAQSAADRLPNHFGNDGPESHVPALWTVATGDPSRTYPVQPARSCGAGTIGYPCFRSDAVRVIILITDAPFHNGPGGANPYAATVLGVTPPTYIQARDALVAANIRVIGVNSGTAGSHLTTLATDTRAVDAGGAAMVYTISSSGTGLGSQVVTAVQTLANNVPIRVDAQFVDDGSDAVNTRTEFLDYIEANVSGASVWDPATSTTRVCTTLGTGDSDGDGHPDYFPSLLPGTSVCWDIHVKRNVTIAATADAQIYRATINVIGDLFTPLDSRDIYFLVPPEIQGSQ
ncbi:MAG: hypothetical protein HY907_02590 [Deltaproteobacteria bacterium]|nr:hypothetical protein [Deltaproteobacteria bacterium]